MPKNLIVLRCGQKSLHRYWLESGNRNWDIVLCPFQEIDSLGLESHFIPGQKWSGLHKFLTENMAWRDYDYICLPDDDLAANGTTFSSFFEQCHLYDISLAAPSLTPNSYWTHLITLENTEFRARMTTFVEIMTPCFSRKFLEAALPTFALSRSGFGFGLDVLWPYMLEYKNIWTIDLAPVHHTRPVGSARDKAIAELAFYDLNQIKCRGIPWYMQIMGGVDKHNRRWLQSEPDFVGRVLEGYSYVAQSQTNQWQFDQLKQVRPVHEVNPLILEYVEKSLAHLASPYKPISRNKPCLTSSVSQWSWSQDPARDATGANDGFLNGNCGFHTEIEIDPWWQVDLGALFDITSVVVYNRLDQVTRCVNFDILCSKDSTNWIAVLCKRDGQPFGGLDGRPFRAGFAPPVQGRFLRIQLAGKNYLHLDQVEVFGTPSAVSDALFRPMMKQTLL